jgi:uncharacterized protein YndB with AHSA1/START domain
MIPLLQAKTTRASMIFSRTIDAVPGALYNAWAAEKQVAAWWGPYGFTNPVCQWEARAGGKIYIEMTSPDGMVFPVKGIFHEVEPFQKIVFTSQAFEDENGNCQLQVLNTVIFTGDKERSEFTLEAKLLKATPVVKESLDGMRQGWNQSLDKLEELLTRTKSNNQ